MTERIKTGVIAKDVHDYGKLAYVSADLLEVNLIEKGQRPLNTFQLRGDEMENKIPKVYVEIYQGVVEVFTNSKMDVLVVDYDCVSDEENNCVIDEKPAAAHREVYDNRDSGLVEKAFAEYEATKKEI